MTSAHQATDVRILHKECRTLAEAGYEVTLVAPHDRNEVLLGTRIHSVPSATKRIQRMTLTAWRVYRATVRQTPQVCHFHDPELIPFALLLKAGGRCVVYDVHENLPDDILDKDYLPSFLRKPFGKLVGALEVAAAQFFDGVVAATPAIARRFPKKRTVVVQNFPFLADAAYVAPAAYVKRPPWVVYVGVVAAVRGFREAVDALSRVRGELDLRLVVAGRFESPEFEEEMMESAAASHIEFLGWQDRDEVASLLSRARIGLVTLRPTSAHMESQPTKLFEYMAAGLPVVASDFPLWRKMVEGIGCCILVDPKDPSQIARALEFLLDHPSQAAEMGRRGREAVKAIYNWDAEAEKMLELYQTLLGQ